MIHLLIEFFQLLGGFGFVIGTTQYFKIRKLEKEIGYTKNELIQFYQKDIPRSEPISYEPRRQLEYKPE